MKLVHVCFLLLASLPSWTMQIFVRGFDGRTFTIDTDADETVLDVKQKIAEKKDLPVEKQRLIYGGKQLEDDVPLCEYGVERSSTLTLYMRVFNVK